MLRCEGFEWLDEDVSGGGGGGGGEGGRHAADASGGGDGGCWIVFDMAYDDTMTPEEHGALSRQVAMCVASNKQAKHPFLLAVASDNPADDANGGRGAEASAEAGAEAGPGAGQSGSGAEAGAGAEAGRGGGECGNSGAEDCTKVASVANNGDSSEAAAPSAAAAAAGDGSPFVTHCDTPAAAAGANSWRRLPWSAWGARGGGPAVWASFHKENLIYLTADSPNVLESINPGDVLILGGVVDHKEKPRYGFDG